MIDADEGAAAALNGEPVTACPYSPGDPAGRSWRAGWVRADAARRNGHVVELAARPGLLSARILRAPT